MDWGDQQLQCEDTGPFTVCGYCVERPAHIRFFQTSKVFLGLLRSVVRASRGVSLAIAHLSCCEVLHTYNIEKVTKLQQLHSVERNCRQNTSYMCW